MTLNLIIQWTHSSENIEGSDDNERQFMKPDLIIKDETKGKRFFCFLLLELISLKNPQFSWKKIQNRKLEIFN